MTSELTRMRNWMEKHNRRVFTTPERHTIESIDQIERLLVDVKHLAESLGMKLNIGAIIARNSTPSITPVILADLTELLRETLATYHVIGIANYAEAAFTESFCKMPNFARVVDDYENEDVYP